jgi:hypothetical protein
VCSDLTHCVLCAVSNPTFAISHRTPPGSSSFSSTYTGDPGPTPSPAGYIISSLVNFSLSFHIPSRPRSTLHCHRLVNRTSSTKNRTGLDRPIAPLSHRAPTATDTFRLLWQLRTARAVHSEGDLTRTDDYPACFSAFSVWTPSSFFSTPTFAPISYPAASPEPRVEACTLRSLFRRDLASRAIAQ